MACRAPAVLILTSAHTCPDRCVRQTVAWCVADANCLIGLLSLGDPGPVIVMQRAPGLCVPWLLHNRTRSRVSRAAAVPSIAGVMHQAVHCSWYTAHDPLPTLCQDVGWSMHTLSPSPDSQRPITNCAHASHFCRRSSSWFCLQHHLTMTTNFIASKCGLTPSAATTRCSLAIVRFTGDKRVASTGAASSGSQLRTGG